MDEKFTEYQQLLLDTFLPTMREQDKGLLFALGAGPKEFGFEQDMLDYLKAHPQATLQELNDFAAPFFPEIVIEED